MQAQCLDNLIRDAVELRDGQMGSTRIAFSLDSVYYEAAAVAAGNGGDLRWAAVLEYVKDIKKVKKRSAERSARSLKR